MSDSPPPGPTTTSESCCDATPDQSPSNVRSNEFEQQAQQPRLGVVAEFVDFLRTNKKWWLTPIIIVIILLTIFCLLSQSVLAPFIYPLF